MYFTIGRSETNVKSIDLIIQLKENCFPDTFDFNIVNNQLFIKRTDCIVSGWDYNHYIIINGYYLFNIGTSKNNVKIIDLSVTHMDDNIHSDIFNFYLDNNHLIIHKKDSNDGWSDNYSVIINNSSNINNINNSNIFLENNLFIIKPVFGLCNRLRAMASAYSIAKKTGKKLIIDWVPDFHCDCTFEYLFENKFKVLNLNVINIHNCDVYNYIETDNGVKFQYINTNTENNIYIKSNCILNNEDSYIYFEDFFAQLKPVKLIQDIIDRYMDSNCIGMHIRNGGGKYYQTDKADNGTLWPDYETELMYKYRAMSDLESFINQINKELYDNPENIFFIATDLNSNYDKLVNIYGENKIKFIKRNIFDRSREQLYYAVADLYLLAKCKKFYGSFWSSFSEIVSYFQSNDTKKHNIFSNEFIYNNSNKFSVIQTCKNRENNLLQSINSYIRCDMVDDIVIVDFNSDKNLKDFLKSNIDKAYFYKLNIIEVNTHVPYICSWSNNIGLYFCKNDTILKLDADNIIVDSNTFFYKYGSYDLKSHFIHFDWKDAKHDREKYLNGLFIVSKKMLIERGYMNNKLLFYGWDDCEVKNRHKKSQIEINFDSSDVFPISNTDSDRVINQNYDLITFFGFKLGEMDEICNLINYNQIFCSINDTITYENDVVSLFNVQETNHRYLKISLNFDTIQYYETNYNPLSESSLSICRNDIFEYLYSSTNCYNIILKTIIGKYNITNIDDKIVLFYIISFNKKTIEDKSPNNLVISLYNETDISRCIELLFCLKKNVDNEYISKIHILFENPDKESFLYYTLTALLNQNINWKNKLIFTNIHLRPTYDNMFSYCNNNIQGTVIIANSDIVYDETLEYLYYLTEDDFMVLTRYQKYNNKFKLIHHSINKVNIHSQDSWMFTSPMKYNISCPINLGKHHCDSFLNYQLYKNRQYKVYNLYKSINSFHIQKNISESQKIDIDYNLSNMMWQDVYKLINYETTNFSYGVRLNLLEDLIHKKNYNNFVNWNTFVNSNTEDMV